MVNAPRAEREGTTNLPSSAAHLGILLLEASKLWSISSNGELRGGVKHL